MPVHNIHPSCDSRFANRVVNFLAGLALLLAVASASAVANTVPGPPIKPDQVGQGSLLLRPMGEGSYHAALVQKTAVEIDVSGLIARAVVRQAFENKSTLHMEGIYVFPLPHKAAVDGLRLVVGERVIEGRIEGRKAAQKQFAQARKQGKRAAMIEGERPNIFTTSVTNIAPGETVRVEIRYQQTLAYENGEMRLRFPMVVGPRYIPGPGRIAKFGKDGWAAQPAAVMSSAHPDDTPVTQPVERPGPDGARRLNPVDLKIVLNAGFPLLEVKSHHHKIAVQVVGEGRRVVALAAGSVPADRDFELTWRPKQGAAPQAGLFIETDAPTATGPHTRHALLMLLPPHAAAVDSNRTARELLFILDTSGSMGGASIRQAKAALIRALDSLGPKDHFNIIEFNSHHSRLFASSRPADGRRLALAKDWIARLDAEGGTNVAPALRVALDQASVNGLLRQVVFLTDGAVSNEAQLFAMIGDKLRKARLFTVGIGSAPNGHFMRGAARAGRGAFVHVGSIDQVGERVDELIAKLTRPALTDIELRFSGGGGNEIARDPVPDLYAGETLMVAAKLTGRAEMVTVTGRRGNDVWSQSLDLEGGQMGPGIGKLWAHRRITALEDNARNFDDRAALDESILALALDYGLVTRLTALIAVDTVVAREAEEDPLLAQKVPANLPSGWQYDKVFFDAAAPREYRASMTRQMASAQVHLPATATPADLYILAGLTLLLLSLALFGWHRVGWRS